MRTVILGLNNPHSKDPSMALGTVPPNASGYRLWMMLKEGGNRVGKDVHENDYLSWFDRINLLEGKFWDDENRVVKKTALYEYLKGRRVVMCGTKVPQLVGVKYTGFHLASLRSMGFVYYVIPHPSGLCRAYNDPEMGVRVGDLLWRLRNG